MQIVLPFIKVFRIFIHLLSSSRCCRIIQTLAGKWGCVAKGRNHNICSPVAHTWEGMLGEERQITSSAWRRYSHWPWTKTSVVKGWQWSQLGFSRSLAWLSPSYRTAHFVAFCKLLLAEIPLAVVPLTCPFGGWKGELVSLCGQKSAGLDEQKLPPNTVPIQSLSSWCKGALDCSFIENFRVDSPKVSIKQQYNNTRGKI